VEISELAGKAILVEMTFKNAAGETVQQEQLFGKVFDTGPQGILLMLDTGREFALPPHTRNLAPAEQRDYIIEPGGRAVRPDYVATWAVTRRD
jgi:hypothetical protein